MKAISIIPARGGSKGVPRKNIRLLNGKPLIYYSIAPSLESSFITRTIVSTDDPEIKQVAMELGAEVIDRPVHLAQDSTPTEPVMRHVVDTLLSSNYEPDLIVLLQPTSPFRTAGMIDRCCSELVQGSDLDSVLTVHLNYRFYWKKQGDLTLPLYTTRERRQDKEPLLEENGNIYITRLSTFLSSGNRLSGKTKAIVNDDLSGLEIDSEYDFWLCEKVMADGWWPNRKNQQD